MVFNHKITHRIDALIIDLEAAKVHLRADGDDEEDLDITRMIKAVARHIEEYLGRFLLTTTIEQGFADWCSPLALRFNDILEISKVNYFDAQNIEQTLDAANYKLQIWSAGSNIHFDQVSALPSLADRLDPVRVTYKAGYGQKASDIPEDIIDAAFMLLSTRYDRHEQGPEVEGTVNQILNCHRIFV